MAGAISKSKLAAYLIDGVQRGDKTSTRELAAYLIETRRTREAEAIVRLAQEMREHQGSVLARVTTARQLDAGLRREIETLLGAEAVEFDEVVDPSVVGGIKIETPSRVFDSTIASRIEKLRERKV